eukprot:SAG25_NODE_1476_length_2946_cov_2.750966_2_plen_78_part_00
MVGRRVARALYLRRPALAIAATRGHHQQSPPGGHNLIPGSARAHTYLGQPAARADSLKELSARSALGNFQLRPVLTH